MLFRSSKKRMRNNMKKHVSVDIPAGQNIPGRRNSISVTAKKRIDSW